MSRYGTILFLLLISVAVQAQKYKDIYPQLLNSDENNAFEILNEFLRIEPDNPNANLRLANIYIKRYKETDVLREYEKALALAEQAKQRLIKSKVTIDDREVRKNQEYYIGVLPNGMYSYEAIVAFIDAEYTAADEFMTKLPPIYREFTSSVEKYDEVIKEFADIVGNHNSLKELYLLYDADLGNRLAALKSNYDSTKYYFNNYLDLRKQYPVKAIEQQYSERPIKVYRLDGLVTQINFLQPEIELWDYASWVDTVNAVVANNIANLRAALVENDKKLKSALVEAAQIDNPDSFKVVTADKSLVFNLMKYDYKNALVPYLNYQAFKQTLIKEQKRKTYFDTAGIAVDRKLAYYNDMLYASRKADSIITDFTNRFDMQQLERHEAFVNETFGDADNLKKYMIEEQARNQAIFMAQVQSIKSAILAEQVTDTLGVEAKYKRLIVPAFVVGKSLQEVGINYLKTQHILSSADESIYVAGQIITDNKLQNVEVAIAKLDQNNKVIWLKNFDFELDSAGADANHILGDLQLTSEGVVAIIRSLAIDESKVANTLIHLTADGDVKFTRRLATELFPRELIYEERLNLFLVSFFGDAVDMDIRNNSTLSLRAVNGLGEEIWYFDYTYSGDYIRMLSTPTQILVAGNYSLIKNEAGRTFTKPAGSNGFILSLDYAGGLQKIKCYASAENYTMNTFYKVSDRNLNLIGTRGEHLIVDGSLENIYSSLTLK